MHMKSAPTSNLAFNALLIALLVATFFYPADAFAQSSGPLFDSGTNFLNALSNLLTSTWARAFGIIAVAVLGIMYMLGRISMQVTIAVVAGIILVFGAPAIVDSVASSIG
jgi:type IV secretion system protein VirB2